MIADSKLGMHPKLNRTSYLGGVPKDLVSTVKRTVTGGGEYYSRRRAFSPPGGGGGGALTLVLGTHCKTDSRSCGCRLEKGGLSLTQEGAVRGAFPVGAVVVSLASPRKASWISYNYCFGYSYKSNYIRTTENDVHWAQTAVTTVITIGFPLMSQKQGAVKQQGQ